MSSSRSLRLGAALCVVAGLVSTGCQAAGVVDKTGGNVIVLRFATIDNLNANGQTVAPTVFIDTLKHLSGARVTVTVQDRYEEGAVTAETDIVTAIADGSLDGGWPATRAFSRAGLRGLEPLEAPLTLTSYSAQKALVTGSTARDLLQTLDGSGIVGLGLTVGALRRPWATTAPLVDVARWRGVTFRTFNSPVQEDAIRALGAVPVGASFNFPELVHAGRLQAVETDVAQYARNGYGTLLPRAVGNEVLWPRMSVLALSRKRFDSLTVQQRGWVTAAAQQAVQASVDFGYDDSAVAARLCGQGVRFIDASPEQLAGLRRTLQPVLDALARDPVTGASMDRVRRIAALFPLPDALTVPATCRAP